LHPPHGAAQVGAAGAQQLASTGALQVGSTSQHDEPQLLQPPPQPSLGSLNFGRRSFGSLIFGSLKQCFFWQPQLSPQVLQPSTGAQQLGSTAVPQAAGAQHDASTGAQQVGSAAAHAAGAQQVASAGAQQEASTGAQQVGSTLQPHPLLCLNRPNRPACALLAIENTTRAAVSVIAFISVLLNIVLAE